MTTMTPEMEALKACLKATWPVKWGDDATVRERLQDVSSMAHSA